jgi:hypothetical protein
MKTCIIQLDSDFRESYIWSDDEDVLKNILKTVDPSLEDVLSYCQGVYSYRTNEHNTIINLASLVFDRVAVIESRESMSRTFQKQCLKKMESLNENT